MRFTENGLVTADDKDYEFDIIVCATGFNVAFAPHLSVVPFPQFIYLNDYSSPIQQDDWHRRRSVAGRMG